MGNRSPELNAFVKCTPKLVTAISEEVNNIGDNLYSEDYLTRELYESLLSSGPGNECLNKARRIVSAVRKIIANKPSRFFKFVQILRGLKSSVIISDCVQELLERYDYERGAPSEDTEKPGQSVSGKHIAVIDSQM